VKNRHFTQYRVVSEKRVFKQVTVQLFASSLLPM
jgi:hypothetical protein